MVTAIYWVHGNQYSKSFETVAKAAEFLLKGELKGALSSDSIINSNSNTIEFDDGTLGELERLIAADEEL